MKLEDIKVGMMVRHTGWKTIGKVQQEHKDGKPVKDSYFITITGFKMVDTNYKKWQPL